MQNTSGLVLRQQVADRSIPDMGCFFAVKTSLKLENNICGTEDE
jgi:hypothetical protein